MTLDKQFHGDLEATSKGQMLAASTEIKGSAGYVAIEKVTGTLRGHSGTFVLVHTGIMTRGALPRAVEERRSTECSCREKRCPPLKPH